TLEDELVKARKKLDEIRERFNNIPEDEDNVFVQEDVVFKYSDGTKTIIFDRLREFDAFDPTKQVWQRHDSNINAAIDNIKDQLLPVLGANTVNSNALSALIGMGFPLKSTIALFNHPLIKEITSGLDIRNTLAVINRKMEELEVAYNSFGKLAEVDTVVLTDDIITNKSISKEGEINKEVIEYQYEILDLFR